MKSPRRLSTGLRGSTAHGSFWRIGLGRWSAQILGLAMLGGLVALRAWDPLPIEVIRLKVFDLYQFLQPREAADDPPAVIVDIDEDSLAEFGQWPWPRDLMADMVRRIFKAGAVAVAFDIIFAEADRLSPPRLAEDMTELDEEVRDGLRRMPDHDALLANIFRQAPVVAAEAGYTTELGDQSAPLRKATFAELSTPWLQWGKRRIGERGGDPRQDLPRFQSLIRNIPALEQAARGLGIATLEPEPGIDDIVRRLPSVIVVGDMLRPTLALELLRVATGEKTYAIESDVAGIRSIVIAGVKIATDRRGRLWVHFSPHDPRRFVSAKDVISGNVPRGRLAGKLVFIGASATGRHDLKATPLNETMPVVEIHAQLVETILAGRQLLRPNYALGAELVLTAVVGLIVILIIPILGPVWTLLVGGTIAFVVIGASWYYYVERLLLIEVSYAMFSSFVIYASLSYLNYFRDVRRQQVRKAFGRILSPALVGRMIKRNQIEQLADHPERL